MLGRRPIIIKTTDASVAQLIAAAQATANGAKPYFAGFVTRLEEKQVDGDILVAMMAPSAEQVKDGLTSQMHAAFWRSCFRI